MKNILLINGHSADKSLSQAMLAAYKQQVESQGHSIHVIELGKLKFDPLLHQGYGVIQELEPDLVDAQKWILWANHIAWFFPVWWTGFPALLKGFIDRCFLPGFAFRYHKKDPLWDKLLSKRSSDVIYTSGTPVWLHKLMGNPLKNMFKAVFGFCGLKPLRILAFGGVRELSPQQVEAILLKTKVFAKSIKG